MKNRVILRSCSKKKMKLPPELADLLGLSSGLLGMGTYVGKIDLQSLKVIYIHCDQISTSENFYNGLAYSVHTFSPNCGKENMTEGCIIHTLSARLSDFNKDLQVYCGGTVSHN